ncbi:hypothetical protein PAPYR_6625 [Paratrimastix pyriformis]|uniref:Uncharacterized protein n=1 Tax=Paratrimastix pyriformis TaxID=342808 RepID=A0ABQ8UGA6_9EUKA|nr:hypothetical protein PAPYR_6625 [Paratrimastix pyriformis]
MALPRDLAVSCPALGVLALPDWWLESPYSLALECPRLRRLETGQSLPIQSAMTSNTMMERILDQVAVKSPLLAELVAPCAVRPETVARTRGLPSLTLLHIGLDLTPWSRSFVENTPKMTSQRPFSLMPCEWVKLSFNFGEWVGQFFHPHPQGVPPNVFSCNPRLPLASSTVGVKRLALGRAPRWGAVRGTVPRAPSLRDRFHLR